MPLLFNQARAYQPQSVYEATYKGFNGGLNTFFKPTEVKKTELVQADNCMLIGAGVVTGRWGSQIYFKAGNSEVTWMGTYQNISSSASIQLLATTNDGYLVKQSGASYTQITGASFASGSVISGSQLGNNLYIVSDTLNYTKYDGSVLTTYTSISRPSVSVSAASFISGATGTATWSYKATAFSTTGETLPSTSVLVNNVNYDRTLFRVNFAWTQPSTASNAITGFGIYAGLPGEETLIATVGPNVRSIVDDGLGFSSTFPPTADTTGGVKAKYIKRFDDRLIIAGIPSDPTMVMISGKYPYQDRFNWQNGGGYIRIAPDSGDEIVGIEVISSGNLGVNGNPSVLIFMKNTVHQMILEYITIGEYSILNPTVQQLAPVGANSFKSIKNIQNNTFYIGRQGLQTVGQEASYLNQIRTAEVSARIRPYMDSFTDKQLENMASGYMDYKYLFSEKETKQTMVYDYERGAFIGAWKTPFGITHWLDYFDNNGKEYYLAGSTDGNVREFSTNYQSDSGTAIIKTLKTKKEDFNNWSVLKVMRILYLLFRNVSGSINVNIILENRSGGTDIIAKSFEVIGETGGTGWGTDLWSTHLWGQTNTNVTQASPTDIIRWINLYKTARTIQIEVSQTATETQFEFADMKISATLQPEGSLSAQLKI
jgi:hypothetical protein